MSIRITCIKKADGLHENLYTAITEIGWINESTGTTGISTRVQIYDWVHEGGEAFVINSSGRRIKLVSVLSARGTKYVKSEELEEETDILLRLGECQHSRV
jgi:hypothetical protein